LIVLGIDPGTATTGYGIVERTGSQIRSLDYGCIQTPSDRPLAERLLEIRAAITDLTQASHPLAGVADPPLGRRTGRATDLARHGARAEAGRRQKHDPRPIAHLRFALSGNGQHFQRPPLLGCQADNRRLRNRFHPLDES